MDPPPRRVGLFAWLIALLCMMAAAPALLIELYRPEVVDDAEAKALATSIHTWTRFNSPAAAGEPFIRTMIPHYNGRSQWRDAPGVTWTQLAIYELLASKPVTTKDAMFTLADDGVFPLPPPLKPISFTGRTVAQVRDLVAAQAQSDLNWGRIEINLSIPVAEPAKGKAAAPGASVNQASIDHLALAAGQRIELKMSYVEPTWRSAVNTVDLIKYARLCSAMLGLVLVGAVFWAAYAIAGLRAGAFAALVCAANPVFIWHARTASMPIHQATWTMVAIAAALWAIRPLRSSPTIERQFLGWVICGLAFGMAALVSGPFVIVTVGGPIMLLLLLCPHRRGHLMGLLAATIIGVLVVVPWTALLHENDADAALNWWNDHRPLSGKLLVNLFQNLWTRLGLVLVALLPWTFWLFAALVQPFSTSSQGSRTRLFLGFSWFLLVTTFLLLQPDTGDVAAWMPLAPAGAVMTGVLFHHYSTLAGEGRFVRSWRWLRWAHLLLLLIVSILAPLFISWPKPFIDNGWFKQAVFLNWGWGYSLSLTLVLIALVVVALRMAIKQYPGWMLGVTAAWMLLLSTVVAIPAARSGMATSAIRRDADNIRKRTNNHPVYALQGDEHGPVTLEPAVLLYAQCEIRSITAKDIDDVAARQRTTIYLISRLDSAAPAPRAEEVIELPTVKMKLWKYESEATAAIP